MACLLYMGGFVASAGIMPEIARRNRLARVWYNWFKRELYDMEHGPWTLNMRIADSQRAAHPSDDVWGNGWWGQPGTRPTRKYIWAQCLAVFLVGLFNGEVRTLDTTIDENRKETAEGVSRFMNQFSSRGRRPWLPSPPGVRFSLSFSPCFLRSCFLPCLAFFPSLPFPSPPSFCRYLPLGRFASLCNNYPSLSAFLLLVAAFTISFFCVIFIMFHSIFIVFFLVFLVVLSLCFCSRLADIALDLLTHADSR